MQKSEENLCAVKGLSLSHMRLKACHERIKLKTCVVKMCREFATCLKMNNELKAQNPCSLRHVVNWLKQWSYGTCHKNFVSRKPPCRKVAHVLRHIPNHIFCHKLYIFKNFWWFFYILLTIFDHSWFLWTKWAQNGRKLPQITQKINFLQFFMNLYIFKNFLWFFIFFEHFWPFLIFGVLGPTLTPSPGPKNQNWAKQKNTTTILS